jgi:hypothetical protein
MRHIQPQGYGGMKSMRFFGLGLPLMELAFFGLMIFATMQ